MDFRYFNLTLYSMSSLTSRRDLEFNAHSWQQGVSAHRLACIFSVSVLNSTVTPSPGVVSSAARCQVTAYQSFKRNQE